MDGQRIPACAGHQLRLSSYCVAIRNKFLPTILNIYRYKFVIEIECSKPYYMPLSESVVYITGDVRMHAASLEKLGKHKTGVGCIYINKLEDIDMKVLKEMINDALKMGHFGK